MPLDANTAIVSALITLLPMSVVGVSIAVMYVALRRIKRSARRENRRHPLKSPLLRPAGYSVGRKSEEALIDVMLYFMFSMLMPALIGNGYLLSIVLGVGRSNVTSAGIYSLAALGSMVWALNKAVSTLRIRRDYRLGWEGELAVGEELAQLSGQGFRVFHDVPDEGFNIDHVVVGPSGIYAIETKARTKRGTEKDAHQVGYDGKTLKFPDYVTDQPLVQAERQAKSLGRWLSKASGIALAPVPVVIIPGWFVDRTGKGRVQVLAVNGARHYLSASREGSSLDRSQIERIAYQLELKCRDVALGEQLI